MDFMNILTKNNCGEVGTAKHVLVLQYCFTGTSFMDNFLYLCFVFVCYTVLSVDCSLVVTCWERADLLALLFVMFSYFCHIPIWCPGSGSGI